MEITTVAELKKAIRTCSAVYARIEFMTNERYFKISKSAAMELANGLGKDADPDMDFQVPYFAKLEGDELSFW